MTATLATKTTRGSSKAELAPTLGPQVCRWIEALCVLGEGDFFGQPVKLRRWQRAILYRLYELNPDGSRRYRRALIGFAKGNGKSPFAAWVSAVELAGPVCFSHWDDRGRPVGRPRVSPVVPVGAASFDQADLVFAELKTIFRESAQLAPFADVFDNEIVLKDRPGRAYRIAAARASNDGGRPSCFVADELHEWNSAAQEGAHLVMANGTAKRADSLQLGVTTAGSDLDTLLGRLYTYGRQVQDGTVTDPAFLFIWYEAPEDLDPTVDADIDAGIRAASPAADDFVNVAEVRAQFKRIPTWEAVRYFWNRFTHAAASWLPSGAWGRCEGAVHIDPAQPSAVAVDMALKHDSIAVLLGQYDSHGRAHVREKIWTPVDGESIDVASVENYLRELHRTQDVREFGYDPAYFERSAQALADDGLPMVEFPQSGARMVPACQDAWQTIVDGRVVQDGGTVLTDHVLSAVPRETDGGWRLSKGKSRRHIDGCIALVMLLAVLARRTPPAVPVGVLDWTALRDLAEVPQPDDQEAYAHDDADAPAAP